MTGSSNESKNSSMRGIRKVSDTVIKLRRLYRHRTGGARLFSLQKRRVQRSRTVRGRSNLYFTKSIITLVRTGLIRVLSHWLGAPQKIDLALESLHIGVLFRPHVGELAHCERSHCLCSTIFGSILIMSSHGISSCDLTLSIDIPDFATTSFGNRVDIGFQRI